MRSLPWKEDLPSRNFQPLRYGLGAWTEHIFFAYDLIAQLRPALFVELGTDRGESYLAFCQSAKENATGTQCVAVDHWRGDSHAGSYDDTTFLDVEAHNRSHYSGFSTLLRSDFDTAREGFREGSIDLLHLDGHHTEEAVRHDLESWLPKLRPGGILLLHDISVQARRFGVWKVWVELAKRGRAGAFTDGPGLGLWEKPPAGPLPPLLSTMFEEPNENRTELLAYYRLRNRGLEEKVAQQWRDGSIRTAPMASETVIQVFWTGDGCYSEEQSVDARIGHDAWKEVSIPLAATNAVTGLRIDFFSALRKVEIAEIEVGSDSVYYRASHPADFEAISLGGDCVRIGPDPFVIQITGIDPQLYLPAFSPALEGKDLILRMKLRVI